MVVNNTRLLIARKLTDDEIAERGLVIPDSTFAYEDISQPGKVFSAARGSIFKDMNILEMTGALYDDWQLHPNGE